MGCRGLCIGALAPATEAGSSDHVGSLGEICVLLPEASFAASRIDKNLTLKALDTESTRREGKLRCCCYECSVQLSRHAPSLARKHWTASPIAGCAPGRS